MGRKPINGDTIMMTQPQLFPVTRELVPEDQRMAVTEKLFGIHFPLQMEPVIYGITDRKMLRQLNWVQPKSLKFS